jgi:hypothetical protein
MRPGEEVVEIIDPEEFNKVIEECLKGEEDDKGFFKLTADHSSAAWKKAIDREMFVRCYSVFWISPSYAHFRKK